MSGSARRKKRLAAIFGRFEGAAGRRKKIVFSLPSFLGSRKSTIRIVREKIRGRGGRERICIRIQGLQCAMQCNVFSFCPFLRYFTGVQRAARKNSETPPASLFFSFNQ